MIHLTFQRSLVQFWCVCCRFLQWTLLSMGTLSSEFSPGHTQSVNSELLHDENAVGTSVCEPDGGQVDYLLISSFS